MYMEKDQYMHVLFVFFFSYWQCLAELTMYLLNLPKSHSHVFVQGL